MFVAFTRRCLFVGFMVFSYLNTALYAAETIYIANIAPKDSAPQPVPDTILKLMPAIDTMIKDDAFGGYAVQHSASIPIPIYGINGIQFSELVSFLKTVTTEYDEYSKSIDLKKVVSLASYNTLLASLSGQDSARLLRLIITANFLNMVGLTQLGAKIWAKNYLGTSKAFNDLEDDIKAVILAYLTPKEFMARVARNKDLDSESTFKVALKVHYEETPTSGTAKAFYESLIKTSGYVRIPGGEYLIGSPEDEADRDKDERLHLVRLSPFWVMEAQVTQEDYAKEMMGSNPSHFNGKSNHPVENLTWFQAQAFAEAKSKNDKIYNYRLLTESEWEASARGGTQTAYICGDDTSKMGDVVWYHGNSTGCTHPVKSKPPNDYGVYIGDVREWTGSIYEKDYSSSEGLDPIGPASGSYRVIRGGCFYYGARYSRSAYRNHATPGYRGDNLGSRLVRTKK